MCDVQTLPTSPTTLPGESTHSHTPSLPATRNRGQSTDKTIESPSSGSQTIARDSSPPKPATVSTTRVQTVKGTCAQFLRQNPRFINEPICHVLPNESSCSVGDCLQWEKGRLKSNTASASTRTQQSKLVRSLDSTAHSDYQPHPADKLPTPLCKHPPTQRTSGIAPLVNEPPATRSKVKELISYRHNYNSRTDPNEPVRGKLHGSFVWDPLKPHLQGITKTSPVKRGSHNNLDTR